jgi:hypothetical protein
MPPLNSSVKPHSEVFPAQMAVTGITMAPSERRASVESEAQQRIQAERATRAAQLKRLAWKQPQTIRLTHSCLS